MGTAFGCTGVSPFHLRLQIGCSRRNTLQQLSIPETDLAVDMERYSPF